MPVDQDRYRSLIARAAFNAEFFRGTIQDLSPAQRAMAFVGAPTWSRINGLPCLKQNAPGDGTASGNVASVVDLTGNVWMEAIVLPNVPSVTSTILAAQLDGATTGFWFFWNNAGGSTGDFRFYLYTAGVVARRVYMNGSVAPPNRPYHVVIASINGGTAGLCWLNGIPVTANLLGAGAAANPAATPLIVGGGAAGLISTLAVRGRQGTPSNEDVSCLAEAAKLMVGGWG